MKMRKRLLSLILCFAMLVSILPAHVIKAAETESTYYVSATGSDENDGTSTATAFATVKKAVEAIEAATEESGIIKIVGEHTLTSADFSAAHTKAVVIEGNDDGAKVNITSDLYAGGPFTFQNITLYYTANNALIYANGHEIVFGDGVTIAGSGTNAGWWSFQNMLSTSGTGNQTYGESHKLTINGGDYYRLYVGNSRIQTSAQSTIPGVDFVMNGGYVFQFILGGDGWDGMWGTNSYTDDVNLTFNGGSVGTNGIILAKYGVSNTYFQGGTNFSGHALQIIMNNGTDILLDAGLTAENVEACNGSLYVLKCAEQTGSTLEPTKMAGTYKVNGDMVAVATDGTNTYKSEAGVLTVEKPGTYTVTWEKYQVSDVAYVSATGSDDNIGTLSKPFQTIEKAVTELSTSSADKVTVKIIGNYALTEADFSVAHTKAVVIKGNDDGAKVNITSDLNAGGPFTFKNIILNWQSGSKTIFANGHELVFGDGVTTAGSGEGWWSFQNMLSMGGKYATATYNIAHKLTINSGEYYRLYVGDSAIGNGATRTIPGVDFTMNNGHVFQFILGGDGWAGMWGTNSYTDDVNLTFNGGSVGASGITLAKYGVNNSYFQGGTNFNGHALQIIINNGKDIPLDPGLTAENVEACNGSLYVLKCAAEEGCYLKTTDVAGQYIVVGNMLAKAVEQSTGEVYRSNNDILTVSKEGVYKVYWERKPDKVYVDAINGDDNNDGGSAEQAVKTLSRAIAASSDQLNPIITVVNKVIYDSNLADDENMTISFEGYDSGAVFAYGGADMTLRSNVNIDNMVLSQDGNDLKIYTNGHNLNIGSKVTFTHGDYNGLENPVIVTGKDGNYERLVLAGSGCAGLTVGNNGAVSKETRLVFNNTVVDKIVVDAQGAEAKIKAIVDGGEVKALKISDDAAFQSVQVIANNGGTILGTSENEKAWYIESDNVAGANVSLTDEAGKFNVTVPANKVAVAVNENGNSVYVADNKNVKDEAPTTNYKSTKYADWGCFTNNGANLVNTYNKLTKDKKLKVAYFGGSLTNGYGCGQAGDPNGTIAQGIDRNLYSWRALSGKWLKDNFPQAEITTVDAAIGESGTYLGVYRVQDDIINSNPDLLFVEYAINDDYFTRSNGQTAQDAYKNAALQFETIIREVKEALPECDIVVVLTTDNEKLSVTYNGELFNTAQAHYDVAAAYDLPVVNIGLGLARGIAEAENNETWWNDSTILKKYIFDSVHPYSTGHYYYYLCMEEFLENNLLYSELEGLSNSRYHLPTVQSEHLMDGDRLNIFGSEMKDYFDLSKSSLASFNEGTFVTGTSDTPRKGYYEVKNGGSIAFDFTGTEFTIWSNVNWSGLQDNFTYTIDGSEEKDLIGSTHAPTIVVSGLASGEHSIVIKATADMQIAALFVRDAEKQTMQGEGSEYADYNSMTVTVPAGKYKVYYVETVGELPIPACEAGKEFSGWLDSNGNPVSADTKLTNGTTLTASFVKQYFVEGFDIAEFNNVVPKPSSVEYEKWLFAGWYEDEDCTQIISDKSAASGTKYAKFVRPEVLTVKAQLLAGTTAESVSTQMRFVSTVDSLDYREVGFEITKNDTTKYVAIKTVYTKIQAKNGGVQFNYTPDVFCSASKYFSTVTLKNIPQSAFSTKINVKPYWITMDGTKVYGEARDISVADGIQ